MKPLINKINKDLERFLKSSEAKEYFLNRVLQTSITTEEVQREIYKSEIRTDFYLEQTRAAKHRKIAVDEEDEEDDNEITDITFERENFIINSQQLDPDESFNSLLLQADHSSNLDYLNGNGLISWNPMNRDSPLLPKLMKFRDVNIAGAKNHKILNDLRAFSLSFTLCLVIVIVKVQSSVSTLKLLIVHPYVNKSYFLDIHNLNHFVLPDIHVTGLTKSILLNIFNSLYVWNHSSSLTENQFTEKHVLPIILPLFSACRGFEISKYDKSMISLTDYKSDLMILLKLKYNSKLEFFICEVKKPNCAGNKYKSDFVKVQREMKAIIDSEVTFGIDDPYCYGLLVEGYDCYLYRMTLPFDGEYRSTLLTQFKILRDAGDLMY